MSSERIFDLNLIEKDYAVAKGGVNADVVKAMEEYLSVLQNQETRIAKHESAYKALDWIADRSNSIRNLLRLGKLAATTGAFLYTIDARNPRNTPQFPS